MWAAAQNHPEMVAFLISKGADLTVRAQANDWETQISSEPRVQYRPTGGLTPLLYAARAGCLGCVKAMLDAGADKDRPNPCLLYTSPSPRDRQKSRMPSSA